jgi:hypothetical protein
MQYTNNFGLPDAVVKALLFDDYDYENAGDLSATGAIQPVRIRQLTKRHGAKLSEDVSDLIWRVIGSIGHRIIERGAPANTFSEERLRTELHGWIITGQVDLMRQHGNTYAIEDFKFRSVWAAKDLKPEDEKQLNIYATLARHNGFVVTQLRIISVLRDWSKLRAAREADYPQVGVVVREVPLWSPEEQEAFLGNRVRAHQQAEKLADDALPMCTEEERWRKPDVWAVKKRGGKRALPGGLHSSQSSAEAWAIIKQGSAAKQSVEIEYRPGVDTRCLHYCTVRDFCSYGKTLAPAATGDEEAA